jgi:hypothetical protein
MDQRTDAWGSRGGNNRKTEKNGPGRQRWKINQRNMKSREKTYERMNILGLEKSMQYLKKIDCKPEDYGKQSYIIFEWQFDLFLYYAFIDSIFHNLVTHFKTQTNLVDLSHKSFIHAKRRTYTNLSFTPRDVRTQIFRSRQETHVKAFQRHLF